MTPSIKVGGFLRPVRPIAVFKDAVGEPYSVRLKVDILGADVPKKMRRERGHGGERVERLGCAAALGCGPWGARAGGISGDGKLR